jgi:glycosyltransferase involved in cell wall biosynthesis
MNIKNAQMKNIAISVIIPIYNAELFLNETIDSVLSQTFSDFELLALDDGSIDNSAEIIKSYNDPRIRYVECTHDFIGTLNKGLSLSQGKYIAQIDHDDMMMPYRLQTQYDFMEENPDIVACGGYMISFERYSFEMKACLTRVNA